MEIRRDGRSGAQGVRFLRALLCVCALATAGAALGEGITKEQGDAILRELEQIRQLLERQPPPKLAAAANRLQPTGPVTVAVNGSPALGSPDAPLTLVEFTDYQCPYCNRFYRTTLPRLKEAYIDTGKLRYVLRDLPLDFHPHARPAAEATHCAGEQGKYWELHDLLFEKAPAIQEQQVLAYAQELALDMDAFTACLESDRYLPGIERDVQAAHSIGITGTPSFVLGASGGDEIEGVKIVGAKSFAVFAKHIDELLDGK